MPSKTKPNNFTLGVAFVLAITLWRVVFLWFDKTDLFVDEVQYWFWGQNLDFGYYSKPPMIAWVIRAVNEVVGSDARFWVRLPAPLFHMATGLILMQAASRFYDRQTAAWVGPVYMLLPAVVLGSVLFSTDTVMLCFYATAMLAYFGLTQKASTPNALLMGAAIGLGLMSKYAMIYFVLCAGLAMVFLPSARISVRDGLIATTVALVLVAPNLVWNLNNGGTTFKHTAENASWDGFQFNLGNWAEFFLSQFGVFGPILFGALIVITGSALARKVARRDVHLLFLSLPILGFMFWQALVSRAYANWAAATYIAASILVTHWLLTHARRWLIASQALHLFIALLLPVLLLFPAQIVLPNGDPLLKRYMGRAQLSRDIHDIAIGAGLTNILSSDRDILSDLHYTLKGQPVRILSMPTSSFPRHYYQQNFAVPAGFDAPSLYVTFRAVPECPDAEVVATQPITSGAYAGRTLTAVRFGAACMAQISPATGT